MEKLSSINLYTLHLVHLSNRYYKLRQNPLYLEKHGYVERTGRTDATGQQYEFTITDKGRAALERFGKT